MPLKQKIKESEIESIHYQMFEEAFDKYGKYRVPSDVAQAISSYSRGLYVLASWNGTGSAARHLASYSIDEKTIIDIVSKYCDEDISEETVIIAPREKRSDKYNKIEAWAKENLFVQKTTEELTEISGFSYQTTLKFLQETPYFRKVKKGLWEARDAKADREAGI